MMQIVQSGLLCKVINSGEIDNFGKVWCLTTKGTGALYQN